MKKQLIITIVLLGIFSTIVNAKGPSIQQRLTNLEKLVEQQPQARDNTADIVMENQKLQQQIAELKGIIEEQNHHIDSLKEKQKLLYTDMDSRLAELESQSVNKVSTQTTNTSGLASPGKKPAQPMVVEVDENYGNSDINTQTINVSEPQLSSYQDEYDIAFAHLRAGRFLVSARAFEDFVQKYPDNDLTDNAYYWLGESYYVKRQYPQALSAFQSLTNKFPSSDKSPDSWLKIGYSYYEMDDLVKAGENLQKVIDSYPGTSIARLAKNRLIQLRRDN